MRVAVGVLVVVIGVIRFKVIVGVDEALGVGVATTLVGWTVPVMTTVAVKDWGVGGGVVLIVMIAVTVIVGVMTGVATGVATTVSLFVNVISAISDAAKVGVTVALIVTTSAEVMMAD